MYSNALYGASLGLYRSTNGGKDWDELFPRGSDVANAVEYTFFQGASIDPQDPRHLLVTFHANCLGQYAPSCMAESTDGGDSWRLFKSPTNGWSEAAKPYILSRNVWLLTTLGDGIFYTEDAGATWQKVGQGASVQMYVADDGSYYLSGNGILKSADGGKTWQSVPGSPSCDALIGDGLHLYAGTPRPGSGPAYYIGAPNGVGSWQGIQSPQAGMGPAYLGIDQVHHVLYSAHGPGGGHLYRMRTQ
jgi:photosystem II stability/assembly factor-like uncharacterized protein